MRVLQCFFWELHNSLLSWMSFIDYLSLTHESFLHRFLPLWWTSIAIFQWSWASITEHILHRIFFTLGFRYYCHYHCINVKNLTRNTHLHALISTHFEFLMYVLGAAFCQQIQIHWIRPLVFSVIEFYDNNGVCWSPLRLFYFKLTTMATLHEQVSENRRFGALQGVWSN